MTVSKNGQQGHGGPARGVRARNVWLTMTILALVMLAAVVYRVLRSGPDQPPRSRPPGFPTAAVSFTGSFPPPGQAALRNPLGVAEHDGTVYVAEADAGRVRSFSLDGTDRGSLEASPAEGAAAFYPVDVAYVQDRGLAVVDTAGSRLLMFRVDGPETRAVPFEAPGTTPGIGKPTAVVARSREVFVADASDKTVHVFTTEGVLARVLRPKVEPDIEFVSAMALARGVLWLCDSNRGRVVGVDPRTGDLREEPVSGFALPKGIDADDNGRLFVVDAFAGTVVSWTIGESPVPVIGPDSPLPKEAWPSKPADVAWTSEQASRLYVSDSTAGSILVYDLRPK